MITAHELIECVKRMDPDALDELARHMAPAIFREITKGRKQVTAALARLAENTLDDAAIAELLGDADGEARGEQLMSQWRPGEERRLLVECYLQGYAEAFCRARRVPAPKVAVGLLTLEHAADQAEALRELGFVPATEVRPGTVEVDPAATASRFEITGGVQEPHRLLTLEGRTVTVRRHGEHEAVARVFEYGEAVVASPRCGLPDLQRIMDPAMTGDVPPVTVLETADGTVVATLERRGMMQVAAVYYPPGIFATEASCPLVDPAKGG